MPTKPKPSKWQPRGIDEGPPIGQLYQEHLDGIVAIADLSLPAAKDQLGKAVLAAAFWLCLGLHYELRPRAGQIDAGFEQVLTLSKALQEALRNLEPNSRKILGNALYDPYGYDWGDEGYGGGGDTALGRHEDLLTKLDVAIEKIRLELPSPARGARKKEAKLEFVTRLAVAWHEATGGAPTRRYSGKTKGDYGPFLEFVSAALAPFDLKVSDKMIKDVIAAHKSRNK